MKTQSDTKIIEEMLRREKEASDYCSTIHNDYKKFNKFSNAPDGQWTQEESNSMGKPLMQTNRVRSYGNQIVNAAVKQDIGCNVEPVSDGADLKLARVRQAQLMKVWDMGKGKQAAAYALRCSIFGNFGVIGQRIKFADNSTMNKKIEFFALKDPTTFFWDPSAVAPACADMSYCIIKTRMTKTGFEKRYGSWKRTSPGQENKWEEDDKKTIREYWRVTETKQPKIATKTGKLYSPEEIAEMEEAPEADGGRDTYDCKVEQFIVANEKILSRSVWPGRRIPYKVVEGREYYQDGKKALQPMIIDAVNPQKKLNFIDSQKTLMFSKGPEELVLVPVESMTSDFIQTLSTATATGSRQIKVVGYKSTDQNGDAVGKPIFKPQLMGDQWLVEETKQAIDDIEACMGVSRAAWLANPERTSGIAIERSEAQGETSNFDFIENWLVAQEEEFRDTLEIIPSLGMTMQIKLAGDDQRNKDVWVNNPNAPAGMENYNIDDEDEEYHLTLKVSPAPKNMRDKSFDQMMDFAKQFPMIAPMISDLAALSSLDGNYAEDISERCNKWIAANFPMVMGQSQDPRVLAAQQQVQMLQQQLQSLSTQAGQQLQRMEAENQTLKIQLQTEKARQVGDTEKAQWEARKEELEVLIKEQDLKITQTRAMIEQTKLLQAQNPPPPKEQKTWSNVA